MDRRISPFYSNVNRAYLSRRSAARFTRFNLLVAAEGDFMDALLVPPIELASAANTGAPGDVRGAARDAII